MAGEEIEELLTRIRTGERQARSELVAYLGDPTRFRGAVLSVVRNLMPKRHPARRRVDSEDVLQSTLLTAMKKLSEFRGESEGSFFGWLRAIIRSKISRSARGVQRERVLGGRFSEGCDPVEEIVNADEIEKLRKAVGLLPLGERLVIELRLRGYNSPQIAKLLSLEPATVRKREQRANDKLKDSLAG